MAVSGVAEGADVVGFNAEVRPLLSKHCLACHGPDEADRKAGFRIDTFEGATANNEGVRGIVPGEPDESEVVYRITADDPDDRMPPPEHGHALSEAEADLLRRWIAEGAQYEEHWAFVPPVKPEVPAVGFDGWARNPVDHFVARKLQAVGLGPSPEAEPAILLRRVSLDLTGLPPSLEEVEAFEGDPSPDAYGRAVDRLLASPRFGERWAAVWLDLARYADTMGYASDDNRTIWRWRDWVIEAFNQNLPYDEFTRLQMAGDLIPGTGPEGLLATAFHRNTLNNTEGGTNDEEFRTVAVKDRLNTTLNVWMGLTMRCAECHSHKYDPISQTEYYQFLDFFNQTADADSSDDAPVERFDPAGAAEKRARLEVAIAAIEAELAATPPDHDAGWDVLEPAAAASSGRATLTTQPDASVLATGQNPDRDTYTVTAPASGDITALRLELLPDPAHHGNVGRHPGGSVAISQVKLAREKPDGTREPVALGEVAADYVQESHRIDKLTEEEPDDIGWGVAHPRDHYGARRVAVFALKSPLALGSGDRLVVEVSQASRWPKTNPGRIRLAVTGRPGAIEVFRTGGLDPRAQELAALRAQLPEPVPTPILRELPPDRRRTTHINLRGNYKDLGDAVAADVPRAFHPLPDGVPRDRRAVADWLVSPQNPLTARVAANRFWARLFGMGLVETEEDFGTQGAPPSHPELLDWLAVTFIEDGWDVKALLRTLVTSATYRQSSAATPRHLERDPRNRYYARAPRFRLPAEMVRDQALAVSGLLSDKMFGPPVYPPSAVKRIRSAFAGELVWEASQGEDRYRRALYTFLKRSQPHPLFETFDMNTREVCSLRRFRTNTPLQSFQTLNDPAFVEAAQALARRMVEDGGATAGSRAAHGLRLALARPGSPDEVAALAQLFETERQHFARNPDEATKMAADPLGPLPEGMPPDELAAWTVVANVILNLDAFLTKG